MQSSRSSTRRRKRARLVLLICAIASCRGFAFRTENYPQAACGGAMRARHVLRQHRKACRSNSIRFADRRQTCEKSISCVHAAQIIVGCRKYSSASQLEFDIVLLIAVSQYLHSNAPLAIAYATAEIAHFPWPLAARTRFAWRRQQARLLQEYFDDDVLTWKASLPAGWCRSSKLLRLKNSRYRPSNSEQEAATPDDTAR